MVAILSKAVGINIKEGRYLGRRLWNQVLV